MSRYFSLVLFPILSVLAPIACTSGTLRPLSPSSDPGATSNVPASMSSLHRLNRTEYNNSVRDVLGSKLSPASTFAPDATANGFDNNAEALTLSPAQVQDYLAAAEALAAELAGNGNQLGNLAPCPPGKAVSDCVAQFVSTTGLRAWRRPLSADEIAAISAAAVSNTGDAYAQQIGRATTILLMSPHFLFRVEVADPAQNPAPARYALATRLSYLLWSSTPDDALLKAAADADFATDAGLRAQVERMLADPKSKALTDSFASQWLHLDSTASLTPDPNYFPSWNEPLRADLIAQTRATFAELLTGAAPYRSLFDGNQTFVNNRLAAFYGAPSVNSDALVKAAVPGRRGLLTQGAILAATSFPSRTSLVHRGQYILSQLLCTPPPPAPANVPSLAVASGEPTTQRQRLEAHATSPGCKTCHALMDPYGYVLETYDAIGASRTLDNNAPIDPSATLTDGTKVSSADDLTARLAADPKVPACFVQQLVTYALGRTLTSDDKAAVQTLNGAFVADGQRVDHLIAEIALSPSFRRVAGANL